MDQGSPRCSGSEPHQRPHPSGFIGNLGDIAPVGEGVSEMRIFYGPGYRVYFIREGKSLVVLLCGGDKSSQKKDIKQAKVLAKEWRG